MRGQKKDWSVYSGHHLASEKGQCGTEREGGRMKSEEEEWNEGAEGGGRRRAVSDYTVSEFVVFEEGVISTSSYAIMGVMTPLMSHAFVFG